MAKFEALDAVKFYENDTYVLVIGSKTVLNLADCFESCPLIRLLS